MVAARQIGTPNRTFKKRVAPNHPAAGRIVKNHRARRMPRHMPYLNFILIAQLIANAFLQINAHRRHNNGTGQPKTRRRSACSRQHRPLQSMQPKRNAIPVGNTLHTQYMVNMRMGI